MIGLENKQSMVIAIDLSESNSIGNVFFKEINGFFLVVCNIDIYFLESFVL